MKYLVTHKSLGCPDFPYRAEIVTSDGKRIEFAFSSYYMCGTKLRLDISGVDADRIQNMQFKNVDLRISLAAGGSDMLMRNVSGSTVHYSMDGTDSASILFEEQ